MHVRLSAMGATDELVGLYWTTSGPVEVHVGREWSLFDLRDRCEQAARVGFAGIGLWHADLEHVLETRTLREVRQLFDDNGLRHLELEFLGDWFLDPDDERRRASDERRALLFEAAAELPAHHIKVGNLVGTECELPRIVERYAELCEDAARHTDAKIVYEFMPYDANVNDVDKALAVVEGADASNGGLALDTWHLGKLRARAGRSPPHPTAVPVLGRALRRAVRVRRGQARRGDQPPQACPARASSRSSSTWPCAGSSATTAPGASRCSQRSSATSPSSRSSSAPTRRRTHTPSHESRRLDGGDREAEMPASPAP